MESAPKSPAGGMMLAPLSPQQSPGHDGIAEKLTRARRELLDLSARNRLLHVARDSPRSGRLDIVKERTEDIYRILVKETRSMTFLASDVTAGKDDDDPDAAFSDDKLQTALPEASLEKRLLKTYYDARTFEEEQGANILFLSLGFLRWYEQDKSDTPRHAPLLLVPVRLERKKAGGKFTLSYDGSELSANLSLAEKLREFRLELPPLPEADELSPTAYFAELRDVIAGRPNWELDENGMVLWFFSFAKFLMFRDLDVRNWPAEGGIASKVSIQALLRDGFRADPPIMADDANLDDVLRPHDLIHILDADSSQTVAIEEVKRGRSLVIQGPPGTGKSQTIANMIAGAVREGKRVLFVAEKTAALQVVKQRLDRADLGALCLELHSHKSNKLAVLEELRRTLELGPPVATNVAENAEALLRERDRLNTYVAAVHTPLMAAGTTPFEAMGQLVRLGAQGFRPLDVPLPKAVIWGRADLAQRQRVLEELAPLLDYVGIPAAHPCRGVHAVNLLPTDRSRVLEQLTGLLGDLDLVQSEGAQLGQLMEVPNAETLNQAGELAAGLHVLGQAPQLDLRCLAAAEWEGPTSHLRALVDAGTQLTALAAQLHETVGDVAWSVDVALARTHIAAHGRSFFRFLSGDYRRARALLRGICKTTPPSSVDDSIALLDALASAQRLRTVIASAHAGASRAFGGHWAGEASAWDSLHQLVSWVEIANGRNASGRVRRAAARIGSPQSAAAHASAFAGRLTGLRAGLDAAVSKLRFDCVEAFGVADIGNVPFVALRERLAPWIEAPKILDRWTAYVGAVSNLEALDLGAFAALISEGKLTPAALVPQLTGSFYEGVLRYAIEQFPGLNGFDGATHAKVIDRFQTLDRERLRMAQYEVCQAHSRGLPIDQGDAGEMGILRKEMSKRRRHLPLRQLLTQAGRSIQAIKPVFMMSPISVAQFLQPGAIDFDLLLIDEASQVQPVDALGAIARCKQIVVVGDEKQLPPTSFFQRLAADAELNDDEDSLGDVQSILALCLAQSVPARMLRWHYRSRHHSLIAVSNREFYDGRLFIPPSPHQAGTGSGLRFQHVADGRFDRGNTATNRREAQVVAEHILAHARETPEASLGVGTFSMVQRDAVLDELEGLRKRHPELETFCARGGQDAFFVKNLESIQGDERDVIFISVGYGRDSSGFMSMSFGPLNNDGGERRLNVLITRARESCQVFSSITADDIDLNKSNARGVVALKQFLQYAATGIHDVGLPTGKDFGSPFEEQVALAVQRHGYVVDSQVGVAGFFVDLAVRDPETPGRYLLGVECDGAQYHSSRCARDRDRLRQQVLEDRGWSIARVWSTDWFRDSTGQTRKIVETLAGLRATPRLAKRPATIEAPPPEVARRTPASVVPPVPSISRYIEASFPSPATPIHVLPIEQLAGVVAQILDIEGPVHRDEVAKRVTGLWGLSRTGSRIAGAVDDALRWLESRNRARTEGEFFGIPGRPVVPRDRENAASATLRKAEYLPPVEVRAALAAAVRANQGIDEERLLTEAVRLLGFKTVGAQVRSVAMQQFHVLVRTKALEVRDGRLYPPANPMP